MCLIFLFNIKYDLFCAKWFFCSDINSNVGNWNEISFVQLLTQILSGHIHKNFYCEILSTIHLIQNDFSASTGIIVFEIYTKFDS